MVSSLGVGEGREGFSVRSELASDGHRFGVLTY